MYQDSWGDVTDMTINKWDVLDNPKHLIWFCQTFFIRICGPPQNYYQLAHRGSDIRATSIYWATHLLFEMWTTAQDTHPPSHTTRSQWRTHLRTFVFWPPPMFGPTKLRREPWVKGSILLPAYPSIVSFQGKMWKTGWVSSTPPFFQTQIKSSKGSKGWDG